MEKTTIDLSADAHDMQNVFGMNDSYVRKLERELSVDIICRDGVVRVTGEEKQAVKARGILERLMELSRRGNMIEEQNVNYALDMSRDGEDDGILEIDSDRICHTVNGKPVKPKTLGQKRYVDAIRDHMIVFGTGPAGTGKTYLAMAMAITAFKNEEDPSGYEHMKEHMMEELKRSFRPEFLNRIDDIIVFHNLDEEDTLKIAALMLKSIAQRLTERNIHLSYTDEVVAKLAKMGFDAEYGARPLRRLMQQTVEDKLSEEILEGNVRLGDEVRMELSGDEFVFKAQNRPEQESGPEEALK